MLPNYRLECAAYCSHQTQHLRNTSSKEDPDYLKACLGSDLHTYRQVSPLQQKTIGEAIIKNNTCGQIGGNEDESPPSNIFEIF